MMDNMIYYFNLLIEAKLKKYGGTAENLGKGKYFPPNLCEGNFFCKEKCESDNIENGNVDFLEDYESNEIFYEASSVWYDEII